MRGYAMRVKMQVSGVFSQARSRDAPETKREKKKATTQHARCVAGQ